MFVSRPTLGAIVIAGLAGRRAVSPAAAGEGGDEAIAACGRPSVRANSVATFSPFTTSIEALSVQTRMIPRVHSPNDEAIRLNPSNAKTLNNRGVSYFEKGEYDRAIQDLDQAIKLQPDYSRAFRNRGDAYRKKGDRDHTIADYREALSFNPDEALRKEIQASLDDLGAGAGAGAPSPSGSSTGRSLQS